MQSTRQCRQLLIVADALEPLEMDESLDYSAATFLDNVNRGGLARPAEYTFVVSVHCWRVFEDIRTSELLRSQFVSAPCQRGMFVKVVDCVTTNQLYGQEFVGDNFCTKGYDLKALLVYRFFNCVAKNLVKHLTNTASEHAQQTKRPKIAKLQSSTTF